MRFNKTYLFILIFCSTIKAEIGITLIGGFNHSNVFHQDEQIQEWSGDIKSLSFAIERKIGPLITSIGYINGGFINGFSDIDTTLNISYLNIESYYPINIGKIRFMGGVYLANPLSAIESYSTVKPEEFNIDYGILTGISFGVTEKIGFRIVLHYGLEDVWKKPIEQRSITTILTGVNIYFNL
jgi:hypothetical protein